MEKKPLIALAAIATVLVILVAILYRKPQQDEHGRGLSQRQAITIAQAGDFYLYAPLYIGADKGFFKENGLDVSIVSTGGDDKTWAAVISGSAQFGVADPTFIAIASERGQPGKIIATVVNGVPFWGITKKASVPTIKKPSDLDSFTVATFPSPSTAYTLQRRMFEMGGRPPKIRQGAFGTLMALLEAGQADIALELEPNVSLASEQGYRIVYSLADVYGAFTITGLTTTPDFIRSNPRAVRGVVMGIAEALTFLHEHPDESAELLARRFPEIKRDVGIAALRRVLEAGVIPQKPEVVESAWRKALQLRIDVGDVKPTPNPMEYVDNTFATQR
jgi:NitT/TauT family transport system substrate-binding protein